MYKSLLVPLDGSELAEVAINEALKAIDWSHPETRMILLMVNEIHPITSEDREIEKKNLMLRSQDYLAKMKKKVEQKVSHIEIVVLNGKSLTEEICKYANNNDVDLVVIASHGIGGFMQWALGSKAEKIIRNCSKPVLIRTRRDAPLDPYLHIDNLPGL